MKRFVETFIEKSKGARVLDELGSIFAEIMQDIGFKGWAYQLVNTSYGENKDPLIVGHFPEEWVDYYLEKNYSEVDPIITEGPNQSSLFQWSKIYKKHVNNAKQADFLKEATDHGFGEGLGIPVHCIGNKFAMMSVVSEETPEELEKILKEYGDQIHIITLVYHSMAKDLIEKDKISFTKDIHLTEQERNCLLWFAKGKSGEDIASILNIKYRTVNFHVQNAKKNLGVSTLHHAIVKAIMHNLITP